MPSQYTDIESVMRRIGASKGRIVVSDDEPSQSNQGEISRARIDSLRLEREAAIESRFGRFYQIPLSLNDDNTRDLIARIATLYTAWDVWLEVHPQAISAELPAAVLEWKKEAEASLEMWAPSKKSSLAMGADPILAGETLIVAATPATAPRVAITRYLPAGGTSD